MPQPLATINFATFLSPVLHKTYEYIACYIGKQTGLPASLSIGQSLEDFATGTVSVGFLCGLLYVRVTDRPGCPLELLAAPVLQGQHYQHRPVYYSDLIVRNDSPYTTFDDLRGFILAFNERTSHSGFHLLFYWLLWGREIPCLFW